MRIIPFHSNRLTPKLVTLQTDGTLGIENIKTVITVVVTFAVDIIAALKDRNYFALLSLLPRLLAQGNIIAIAGIAWKELKDTTFIESNDVHLHFVETLDLENDETEELIEYSFGLVPRIYGFAIDALTFTANVRGFYEEVKDKFGGGTKTVKLAEKAKVDQLLKAA
jgi:hypothetical protein